MHTRSVGNTFSFPVYNIIHFEATCSMYMYICICIYVHSQRCTLTSDLSPCLQVLVVSWRSQQLKQYQWEKRKGTEGGEGGERGKGVKCVRSWRPLQGSVVAMAIDSTSTLLATGIYVQCTLYIIFIQCTCTCNSMYMYMYTVYGAHHVLSRFQ